MANVQPAKIIDAHPRLHIRSPRVHPRTARDDAIRVDTAGNERSGVLRLRSVLPIPGLLIDESCAVRDTFLAVTREVAGCDAGLVAVAAPSKADADAWVLQDKALGRGALEVCCITGVAAPGDYAYSGVVEVWVCVKRGGAV